ncbi:MAG: hypothetical protein AAGG68_30680 [Bacteroidota bacterium]
MKRLIELIDLINKHKIKQLDVIGLSNDTSAPQRLYNIISEQNIETDKEAAALLAKGSPRDLSYKRAKSKLLRRLINTVLFIDAKKAMYNNYQTAYYNCWKNFAAAKILVGKSANVNGNFLLAETLHIAEKYEFTELAMHIAKQLRYQYGGLEGKRKLFTQYNEIYQKHKAIFEAESLVDEHYTRLITYFAANRGKASELTKAAAESLREIDLSVLLTQFNSYQLHLRGRIIQLMALSGYEQKEKYIQACDEAIAFFKQKMDVNPNSIHVFMHNKIVCCIQYLDYHEGKIALKAAMEQSTSNTHNWFLDHYYSMMLSLRFGHYEEAYESFELLDGNKKLKNQTDQITEGISVARAYFHYLAAIGKVRESATTNFNLRTFLRKIPTFARDKGGLNIPILIVQILLLLQQEKYEEITTRLEALKKYGGKYIKAQDRPRVTCFINMLARISMSRFHKEATSRNTKKFRERLRQFPIEKYGQNYAIEIIPYEYLWEMIMEGLDNQMH